ncbi:MAG: uroporphyrinogen-III synthase [Arenibacterium sp.]
MEDHKPLLFLTRPRAASERIAESLPEELAVAIDLCIAPLIEIETLNAPVHMAGIRGVIFTSANAVQAAATLKVDPVCPAYCVGAVTTHSAEQSGWPATQCGETAQELLSALKSQSPDTPLLHLSGRNIRIDLSEELSNLGIETRNCAIYDQPIQALSDAAKARLASAQTVIAPVFSPRTAGEFVKQVSTSERIHVIAMSSVVAEALSERNWASLTVAENPTAESMSCDIVTAFKRLTRVEGHSGPK